MEEWYYALNGQQQGPVGRAVLMQLLSGGNLPADSLVWREGMAEWVAANTVAELNVVNQPAWAGGVQPMLNYGVGDTAYAAAAGQARYAGFWIRFCGAFIDGIVVGVGSAVIQQGVGAMAMTASTGSANPIYVLTGVNWTITTCIGWLYVALMQSSTNQATLGEMATSLQITDLGGRRITFARATGRYFAKLLSDFSCLLFGFGYLMMLWSPRRQTLHDLISETVVVYK